MLPVSAPATEDYGRRTVSAKAEGRSIEVLHGEFSAFRQEQHNSALIEAALTNGALDGVLAR
jgi:hypothetical protein